MLSAQLLLLISQQFVCEQMPRTTNKSQGLHGPATLQIVLFKLIEFEAQRHLPSRHQQFLCRPFLGDAEGPHYVWLWG
jgi:hypothetical protein